MRDQEPPDRLGERGSSTEGFAGEARASMKPDRFLSFATLAVLLLLAGCTVPPPMMGSADCEALCSRQGRTVKRYLVGSAVPIFKPQPPVTCECQ